MTSIISVKFASISPEEYRAVIDHYNHIKPSHFLLLEQLDRCEGGFQIALDRCEIALDGRKEEPVNKTIKQLRWNRRKLDPLNFIGFNQEETRLLYQSLIHVFGQTEVTLESYFDFNFE
jgi:hypothetical protein